MDNYYLVMLIISHNYDESYIIFAVLF